MESLREALQMLSASPQSNGSPTPTLETRLVRSRRRPLLPRKLRVVQAERAAEAVLGGVAQAAADPAAAALAHLDQQRHRVGPRLEVRPSRC